MQILRNISPDPRYIIVNNQNERTMNNKTNKRNPGDELVRELLNRIFIDGYKPNHALDKELRRVAKESRR